MYYLEHQGVSLDLFSPNRRTESSNLNISRSSFDTNILCLQEVHGKDEYNQAIQVLAPRFRVFFGTFTPENENAGASAISIHRDILPEEAIVTHLVTCHDRDHFVNIQSGRDNLLLLMSISNQNIPGDNYVAGCIFFTRTGLHIPMVWALLWVTSTSVIQKKDDSTCGTSHSPMDPVHPE